MSDDGSSSDKSETQYSNAPLLMAVIDGGRRSSESDSQWEKLLSLISVTVGGIESDDRATQLANSSFEMAASDEGSVISVSDWHDLKTPSPSDVIVSGRLIFLSEKQFSKALGSIVVNKEGSWISSRFSQFRNVASLISVSSQFRRIS